MRRWREQAQLPTVTVGQLRSMPTWRIGLAASALVLLLIGFVTRDVEPVGSAAPLSASLTGSTVAVRIPVAWLAAPPPPLARGDRVDVLGVRPGDRSSVAGVVVDARVLAADQDGVVVEAVADDAAALALARAASYVLVLLLRGRP